jgi:lipoyl-dependent peroxiredoxin
MDRKASAEWSGGLKDGTGSLTTPSGVLSGTPYSFRTRFEQEPGTNPEELIGAAHAGCFSMALSGELDKAGLTAKWIRTDATVHLETGADGPRIDRVHLKVEANVPGADVAAFEKAAQAAKAGCPVSRLLNADISMEARLVN